MSRNNVDFVRNIVLENPELFDELFKMVLSHSDPLSRRAIWSLDYCSELQPDLLDENKLRLLIESIPNYPHPGLVRHSLRILARYEIPESHTGKLISLCFDLLLEPKTTIASKAWCMDILYNFSEKEPLLKPELIAAIEFQQENASAGIKNKSRKLLKKLYKEVG